MSTTPSDFKTSEKSIFSIIPLLKGLKPIAACKRFLGSEISSVYMALPVTCFIALSCSTFFTKVLEVINRNFFIIIFIPKSI